jgi:hypothetical protein
VNFNLVEVFFLLLFPSVHNKHDTNNKTIFEKKIYFILREMAKLCFSFTPSLVTKSLSAIYCLVIKPYPTFVLASVFFAFS